MATPSWAQWAKQWLITYPKVGPARSAKERVLSALGVFNTVRTKLNPFEEPLSEVTEENWAPLMEQLYWQLRPCPPEPAVLKRLIERARRRKGPSAEIRFDVPNIYGAESNGAPTRLAVFRLIAALHWTIASLCEEIEDRPRSVCSLVNEHFALLRENFPMRVMWQRREGLGPQPELVLTAFGVDSQAWITLLDFFKSHPDWRDIIGKCPQCLKLFEKPRRDAKYCSDACADKARYERWKERGGLRERKRRRLKAKEGNSQFSC